MFVSWEGSSVGNPYGTGESFIVLSHVDVPDMLVLAELENDRGYNRSFADWNRSAGRSLRGGLRIQGNRLETTFWELTFLVTQPQRELFDRLLGSQQNSNQPVILEDAFTGNNQSDVWLDVDNRYLTPASAQVWWRLQFTALEV